MSALDPIVYIGLSAIDASFLVADGESRTSTVRMYTYQWWGSVSGVAVFFIRTSTNNNAGNHLILTPSGQEICPTRLINSIGGWSIEQVAFKVDPARPYIQFVICPMCSNTEDSITLEGTNLAISHFALSDAPLEGIASLVGSSRLFTPEEALEVIQIPVNPPR